MHPFIRTASLFASLLATALVAQAQSSNQESKEVKEAGATISGRVTLGGKPVQGVTVLSSPHQESFIERAPAQKATTDEAGRFRLTGVAAGRHSVSTFAPALVSSGDTNPWGRGKLVTVEDGEQVEGIDFSLTRGGVITGRVTDADGRPAIGQQIDLSRLDEHEQRRTVEGYNRWMYKTDDRGVYRVYGLPPGRYVASVGEAAEFLGFGSSPYVRTFHPNVTDGSKAAVIEVTEGGEATGIDITLSRALKTFAASGRVLDAETGKPVPDVQFAYTTLSPEAEGGGYTGNRTNAKGEFRIERVRPGRHVAFVLAEGESDYYSDLAPFEVANENVSGIEIKLRRGSSVSGVVTVEGTTDPDILARLSDLRLMGYVSSQEMTAPRMGMTNIEADGSFSIKGLRTGKLRIRLGGFMQPKGFSLLRVEREGVEQRDGIEVNAGEHVSGVRVVLAYGNGIIRGRLIVEGGELPDDLRLYVTCTPAGSNGNAAKPMGAEVDSRRRFVIEGLSAGEYELTVLTESSRREPRIPPTKHSVTVTQEGTSNVTITLNLAAKDKDR